MFIVVVLINLFVTVCLCINMLISCGSCCKKGKEEDKILKEGDGEGRRGDDSCSDSSRNASNARDSFRSSGRRWRSLNPTMNEFFDQLVGSKKTDSQQGIASNPGDSDIDQRRPPKTRRSTCDHKADIYWQPEVKLTEIRSDDTLCYIDAIPEIH